MQFRYQRRKQESEELKICYSQISILIAHCHVVYHIWLIFSFYEKSFFCYLRGIFRYPLMKELFTENSTEKSSPFRARNKMLLFKLNGLV